MKKHEPFDGVINPIEKIPDYANMTREERKKQFLTFNASQILPIPRYNLSHLAVDWQKANEDQKREKLLYTVLYLGDYNLTYRENTAGHPGIDIILPPGTPIRTIANGVVMTAKTGYNYGAGNNVVVRHDNVPDPDDVTKKTTLFSVYEHLESLGVKKGDVVTRGQVIAKSGNSGHSTAPHLHFQVDRANAPYHPYWPKSFGGDFSDVKKYTVHPLNFVYSNENAKIVVKDATTGAVAEKPVEVVKKVEETPKVVAVAENKNKILNQVQKDKLKSILTIHTSQLLASVGNPISIIVRAQNGVKNDVEIKSSGASGRFNKKVLKPSDFVNGEAVVRFAPTGAGTVKIVAVGENTAETEIEVKNKQVANNGVAKFGIVASKMYAGQAQTVKIEMRDAKNNKINGNFVGDAEISVRNAYANKTTVMVKDFVDGVAKIEVTPREKGIVNIGVRAGALVGSVRVQALAGQKANFTDVLKNHAHFRAIEWARANKIFNGFPDGSFKPEKAVTRAQLVKIVLAAAKVAEGDAESVKFTDVAGNAWYRGWLAAAVKRGIVGGFADGTFRPDVAVTRDAAFKIILNTLGVDLQSGESGFGDVAGNAWFSDFAGTARVKKLLDFANDKFEASREMSRGEVAEVLWRLENL